MKGRLYYPLQSEMRASIHVNRTLHRYEPGEFPMYQHQRLNNAPACALVVHHYPAATLQIGGLPFYLGKHQPSTLSHRIYR